ncbi:hypothetical protein FB45DRAFT_872742 [Roridomyces roridus]|uniref:Uncharacterized protein n=1 Tax=Roridomyces roridus TaxID=1738132 RepID=A0AAD7FGK0_9AGAR|nr:hypothetical protein FB45DRAFT_872742 [Roridomyces roridus]
MSDFGHLGYATRFERATDVLEVVLVGGRQCRRTGNSRPSGDGKAAFRHISGTASWSRRFARDEGEAGPPLQEGEAELEVAIAMLEKTANVPQSERTTVHPVMRKYPPPHCQYQRRRSTSGAQRTPTGSYGHWVTLMQHSGVYPLLQAGGGLVVHDGEAGPAPVEQGGEEELEMAMAMAAGAKRSRPREAMAFECMVPFGFG